MDERKIVDSAISHINNAIAEINSFSGSNLNQTSKNELELAHKSLQDTISHCLGIFGPSTIKNKRTLPDV
jgi:hypothetical protein